MNTAENQNDTNPADKWAAEKAAHALGKRIETRWMHDGDWTHWVTCKRHSSTWHSEYTSQEYRIAQDPAPAGKTDEQLGEIGKAAAKCTVHWSQINTAFAAAVREAVGKEQAEEIEKLKNAHAMEFVCLNKVLPINRDGSVKIVDHAIATVRYLTTASAQQAEEIARLTAEVQSLNESYRVAGRVVREVQAELVKANAELERLRESLSRIALLPEKWENEPAGIDPSGVMDCVRELRSAFSPAPTAEEKEKLECEKWVKTQPDITHESIAIAWRAWQAARGKEAK